MKLPCYSKSPSTEPLKRVLAETSYYHDMEREEVAAVVGTFLEELADEVAHGNVVSLPGFGAFGAWLIESRAALARDPSQRCKVQFSPARRFTEQVRKTAPAAQCAKKKLIRHRRNHSVWSRSGDRSSVPTLTPEEFRESIARQMAQS